MKRFVAMIVLLSALSASFGQVIPTRPPTQSHSGQFIVSGQSATFIVPTQIATNRSLVRLEPTLVAVSCERIKQALLNELGVTQDKWHGKIYVVLHRAQSVDEQFAVTTEKFTDGWSYRIDAPDAVRADQFVRVATQVLLLEMANRGNGERLAEAPALLSEGLAELILASSKTELVVQPPQFSAHGIKFSPQSFDISSRRPKNNSGSQSWMNESHPLARVRDVLANRAPLTFDELSWPKPEQFIGDAAQVYRSSAEVFFYELLRLKNGRAELRDFIASLHKQLNWQLTFLEVFHEDFNRQIDLEKWWALQSAHFAGRDLSQVWNRDESWKKLDNILHPDVQVHVGAKESPMRAEINLQSVIREWDFLEQTKILREKSRQLRDAQLRLAPQLITLTEQYRQVLEKYLQEMQKAGPLPIGKNQFRQSVKKVIADTLIQLDALDAKAGALRTMPIAGGS